MPVCVCLSLSQISPHHAIILCSSTKEKKGREAKCRDATGRTLVAPTPVYYERERRRHSRGGALTGYCSRRETIHRVVSVVGFAPPLCARIKEVDPPDAPPPTRTGQRVGPWNSETLQTHADNNAVTHRSWNTTLVVLLLLLLLLLLREHLRIQKKLTAGGSRRRLSVPTSLIMQWMAEQRRNPSFQMRTRKRHDTKLHQRCWGPQAYLMRVSGSVNPPA